MYINNNISGPKSDSIYRFDNQKTGETQRTDHSTHNVLLEKDCCMDFDWNQLEVILHLRVVGHVIIIQDNMRSLTQPCLSWVRANHDLCVKSSPPLAARVANLNPRPCGQPVAPAGAI